ncbi:MAG TPA: flagellar basal body-associated FliL family protein [Verrucomicrobiae bacterium]|nr:flagellar basal body-associated FliL family protein [Verrucomicrobiae bacterium]
MAAEDATQAEWTGSRRALAAFGAFSLVASVAAAASWLGFLPARTAAEARVEEPAVGALLPLDPFIANLADEDGRRYLKATLQVEFFGPRVPDEFNARVPQMRDLLLTLLTSKLFAEIRTPDGKAVLRDEIINRMNVALNKDLVKAVYFTEFIVQ